MADSEEYWHRVKVAHNLTARVVSTLRSARCDSEEATHRMEVKDPECGDVHHIYMRLTSSAVRLLYREFYPHYMLHGHLPVSLHEVARGPFRLFFDLDKGSLDCNSGLLLPVEKRMLLERVASVIAKTVNEVYTSEHGCSVFTAHSQTKFSAHLSFPTVVTDAGAIDYVLEKVENELGEDASLVDRMVYNRPIMIRTAFSPKTKPDGGLERPLIYAGRVLPKKNKISAHKRGDIPAVKDKYSYDGFLALCNLKSIHTTTNVLTTHRQEHRIRKRKRAMLDISYDEQWPYNVEPLYLYEIEQKVLEKMRDGDVNEMFSFLGKHCVNLVGGKESRSMGSIYFRIRDPRGQPNFIQLSTPGLNTMFCRYDDMFPAHTGLLKEFKRSGYLKSRLQKDFVPFTEGRPQEAVRKHGRDILNVYPGYLWSRADCERAFEKVKRDAGLRQDFALILYHLYYTLAGGKDDRYQYICSWLRYTYEYPMLRIGVLLAFYGDQGTGKSIFIQFVKQIFGRLARSVSDLQNVLERFNDILRDITFLHIEEGVWPGRKHMVGKMKNWITEPNVDTEAKYEPRKTTDIYWNAALTTNADWFVPADTKGRERRYVINQVKFNPEIHTAEYMARLATCLKRKIFQKAFWWFIMEDAPVFPVDWHPNQWPIPKSTLEDLELQQSFTQHPISDYINEVIMRRYFVHPEFENTREPDLTQVDNETHRQLSRLLKREDNELWVRVLAADDIYDDFMYFFTTKGYKCTKPNKKMFMHRVRELTNGADTCNFDYEVYNELPCHERFTKRRDTFSYADQIVVVNRDFVRIGKYDDFASAFQERMKKRTAYGSFLGLLDAMEEDSGSFEETSSPVLAGPVVYELCDFINFRV